MLSPGAMSIDPGHSGAIVSPSFSGGFGIFPPPNAATSVKV